MNKEIKKEFCIMALKQKLGEEYNLNKFKVLIMAEYNLSSREKLMEKMDKVGRELEKKFKTVGEAKEYLNKNRRKNGE